MSNEKLLQQFELEDFEQLAAIFSNKRVVTILEEYGIADHGDGPVIARNLNSGLLYVAVEPTSFCFVLGPYLNDRDVKLMWESPLDCAECRSLEEFEGYIEDLDKEALEDIDVSFVITIFEKWESKE